LQRPRKPLLLAIDDAQWADEPSLRFLLHLAHRLAGLPVVVALTMRSDAERHRQDLGSLMLEARPPVLRPRPLGESAVARLVRNSLGDDASDELCRACAEATGGNPFLLSELLGEFRREARPANAIDPRAVDRLAPERIAAAVLLRVSRLDPQAPALGRAVAVLGEQAHLTMCAELAGLDVRTASTLGARLVDLAVSSVASHCAAHPIVRTAIYNDLSATERADRHACGKLLGSACRPGCDRGSSGRHRRAATATSSPCCGGRTIGIGGGAPTPRRSSCAELAEPPDARTVRRCCSSSATPNTSSATAAPGHLREAGETATDPLFARTQ
jgi:hypothetical protein